MSKECLDMSKTPKVILRFRQFQMPQQLHEFYTFYDVYKTRNSIPNDTTGNTVNSGGASLQNEVQ